MRTGYRRHAVRRTVELQEYTTYGKNIKDGGEFDLYHIKHGTLQKAYTHGYELSLFIIQILHKYKYVKKNKELITEFWYRERHIRQTQLQVKKVLNQVIVVVKGVHVAIVILKG